MIVTAIAKPKTITAIKWQTNEEDVRKFIGDESLIHMVGNDMEVYNVEERDWVRIPVFHWIIKGIKGEFYPCSPEVFERSYEIVPSGDEKVKSIDSND